MKSLIDAFREQQWKSRWLELPEMKLRQSSIRDFRYCPASYNFKRQKTESVILPNYYLLGSLFHSICERLLLGLDPFPERILDGLLLERDYDIDRPDDIAHRVWDKEVYYGDSLMDLAYKTVNLIRSNNIKYDPSSVEKMIGFKLGSVSFSGTPDFVGNWNGLNVIFDFKSSGLSKKFFGSGSVSANSYNKFQITYSTQLQHYDWLLYRTSGIKADHYGYILPVNMVVNTKTGKPRGHALQMADAQSLDGLINAYEDDLFGVAKSIARCSLEGSWPRNRPEMYGKLDCIRCAFKEACLGQRTINKPGWLK